eukprot:GHVT01088603.1.p1 GENE.GHVT01088603.1~~GHVT01088603.1.p1  ORF type:complete len:361 (+),score=36.06 GHVT01088603.1:1931-3013(+)
MNAYSQPDHPPAMQQSSPASERSARIVSTPVGKNNRSVFPSTAEPAGALGDEASSTPAEIANAEASPSVTATPSISPRSETSRQARGPPPLPPTRSGSWLPRVALLAAQHPKRLTSASASSPRAAKSEVLRTSDSRPAGSRDTTVPCRTSASCRTGRTDARCRGVAVRSSSQGSETASRHAIDSAGQNSPATLKRWPSSTRRNAKRTDESEQHSRAHGMDQHNRVQPHGDIHRKQLQTKAPTPSLVDFTAPRIENVQQAGETFKKVKTTEHRQDDSVIPPGTSDSAIVPDFDRRIVTQVANSKSPESDSESHGTEVHVPLEDKSPCQFHDSRVTCASPSSETSLHHTSPVPPPTAVGVVR